MQTSVVDSSPSAWHVLRRVVLVYGVLAFLSLTYRYLGGEITQFGSLRSVNTARWVVLFGLLAWSNAATVALVLELGRKLCGRARRGSVLYLLPAIFQITQDLVEWRFEFEFSYLLRAYLYFLDTLLLMFGVRLLWLAYLIYVKRSDVSAGEALATEVPTEDTEPSIDTAAVLLGQGNGYVDRVIRSVFGRSARAERAANFSLTVMLILVLVGGMASFGLWVFTHADRIATIEAERRNLIRLTNEMQSLRNKPDQELKDRVNRLLEMVEQNYSSSESYKDTLDRLSLQSQTNLADIAIRVTIAVLTIFLVQVFFAVYKYNRHLGSVLAAKAEALELAANDDDARRELSHEAVGIVKESVPGFGPQPRTPYEQAVGVAEKFAKR